MSRMLTFHDAAWASARAAATEGRRADALAAPAPLLHGAGVPTRLLLLAHRLAGRIHAAAERYGKARKHLLAAAKLDPTIAEVHYEIGLAFENDPYGCDRRAARRFLHAVKLDPRPARFTAAAGRALVRINRVKAGVKHLRTAAEMAPADAAVLVVVLDGLCDAGKVKAAQAIVTKALFLAPGDAKIEQLRDDVRYAIARQQQKRVRPAIGRGPVVLPFLSVAGSTVRRDVRSRPTPHFARLRAYRAERG